MSTALAVYEARGVDLEQELAPGLRVREVICRCGPACGSWRLAPELVAAWTMLRQRWGRPVRIASGVRCLNHAAERDKAQPGCHWRGQALDLRWPLEVALWPEFARLVGTVFGGGGIGLYAWGLHGDVRGTRARWVDAGAGVIAPELVKELAHINGR